MKDKAKDVKTVGAKVKRTVAKKVVLMDIEKVDAMEF
jgi:hypothetical protein